MYSQCLSQKTSFGMVSLLKEAKVPLGISSVLFPKSSSDHVLPCAGFPLPTPSLSSHPIHASGTKWEGGRGRKTWPPGGMEGCGQFPWTDRWLRGHCAHSFAAQGPDPGLAWPRWMYFSVSPSFFFLKAHWFCLLPSFLSLLSPFLPLSSGHFALSVSVATSPYLLSPLG